MRRGWMIGLMLTAIIGLVRRTSNR